MLSHSEQNFISTKVVPLSSIVLSSSSFMRSLSASCSSSSSSLLCLKNHIYSQKLLDKIVSIDHNKNNCKKCIVYLITFSRFVLHTLRKVLFLFAKSKQNVKLEHVIVMKILKRARKKLTLLIFK